MSTHTAARARFSAQRMLAGILAGVMLLVVAAVDVSPAHAVPVQTAAREVIVVDDATGAVLYAKNADVRMPPASMSKLMTAYAVFRRLKDGTLSMEDRFRVTENAWRMGGSKMFVELHNDIAVSDLLRGVIVQSGNDACVVLAEGLSGSEAAFSAHMNELAKEIGLHNSNFTNATGWPDPNHYMTARDLATLAHRIIHDFPEYYPIYAEKEFTYHGITQGNRNPLLYRTGVQVDGLKTGHTEEAGYGVTVSGVGADGRRVIAVVTGLKNMNERARESEAMLRYGLLNFENRLVFAQGAPVVDAPVWFGVHDSVPLVVPQDVRLTLPRAATKDAVKLTVAYDAPLPAPVKAGQQVGELKVTLTLAGQGGEDPGALTFPLVAGADVAELGPMQRIIPRLSYYLLGE